MGGALCIVEVAKDNGFGGAGLLAGRDNLQAREFFGSDPAVIFDGAEFRRFSGGVIDRPISLGIDSRAIDTLHAVSAFLHNAPTAHCDVGIFLHVQGELGMVIVLEKVETADFIGTVVRAVTSSNAAVVSHFIEAFIGVAGGFDGADDFTRGVFAVLAGHGLEEHFGIRAGLSEGGCVGTAIIRVDANPVHLAATKDLFFSDDRNIVFGLACDNTGVAPDAGGEVDDHAPFVAGVAIFIVEGEMDG